MKTKPAHVISDTNKIFNWKIAKVLTLLFFCCYLFNTYLSFSLNEYKNVPDAQLGYARYPGKQWIYWFPDSSLKSERIPYNLIPSKQSGEVRILILINCFDRFNDRFQKQNRDLFLTALRACFKKTFNINNLSIIISIQDEYHSFQIIDLTKILVSNINPDYSIICSVLSELVSYPARQNEKYSLMLKQYLCDIHIIRKLMLYIRPNFRTQDYRDVSSISSAKSYHFSSEEQYHNEAFSTLKKLSARNPLIIILNNNPELFFLNSMNNDPNCQFLLLDENELSQNSLISIIVHSFAKYINSSNK